jgi:hypothetical protein
MLTGEGANLFFAKTQIFHISIFFYDNEAVTHKYKIILSLFILFPDYYFQDFHACSL